MSLQQGEQPCTFVLRAIELSRLCTIDCAYVIYDHHYRAALNVIEPARD